MHVLSGSMIRHSRFAFASVTHSFSEEAKCRVMAKVEFVALLFEDFSASCAPVTPGRITDNTHVSDKDPINWNDQSTPFPRHTCLVP